MTPVDRRERNEYSMIERKTRQSKIDGGLTSTARTFRLAIVTALLGILFAAPTPSIAQTNPGDFLLFGVNLSGTAPWMNDKGQSISSGILATPDSRLILSIPTGTFIRNAAAQPQPFISATLVANPPAPPSQQILIIAYELGTPGATFSPTIGLKYWYPDAALPPSVAESSLYIAEWNGSAWVKLPGTIDSAANTVSTSIANFTIYALFGNTQPPSTTTSAPPATTTATQTTPPATTSTIPPSSTNSSGFLADSPLTAFLLIGAVVLIVVLFLIARKQ